VIGVGSPDRYDPEGVEIAENDIVWPVRDEIEPVLEGLTVMALKLFLPFLHLK
jgi:hypothetical protein